MKQSIFPCGVLAVLWSLSAPSVQASVQVQRFLSAKANIRAWEGDPPKDDEEPSDMSEVGQEMVTKVTKAVKWPEKSAVPHLFAVLIGMVWVLLLGSAPIIIYKMDDERAVTRTGLILSGLMWSALFGGLYLFTHVIVFSSPHFDRVRSLTIVECIYFMTQVITTVGYGDITPAMPRGQVFVGMYVILSFFVIALLVSELQKVVMQRVDHYKQELDKRAGARSGHHEIVTFKPEKPCPVQLLLSLGAFLLIATVWVFFFHFWAGENKGWREATYMALITLTTVGFGAVTPVTEGGMVFGAFFMFFGSSALVGLVTNFAQYSMLMGEWEAWDPKGLQKDLMKLHEADNGVNGISEMDFMKFTLIHKNIITQDQLDAIKVAYEGMKATPRRSVSVKHIASFSGVGAQDLGISDGEEESK